jgi:hypothetical protein
MSKSSVQKDFSRQKLLLVMRLPFSDIANRIIEQIWSYCIVHITVTEFVQTNTKMFKCSVQKDFSHQKLFNNNTPYWWGSLLETANRTAEQIRNRVYRVYWCLKICGVGGDGPNAPWFLRHWNLCTCATW